jgi:hypothetical protein
VIPAPGRQEEDHEFEASLGYIVRPWREIKRQRKRQTAKTAEKELCDNVEGF